MKVESKEEEEEEVGIIKKEERETKKKEKEYPDRPGEPDCLYFLRTGMCGYGNNCRFNHPPHVAKVNFNSIYLLLL